MGSPKGDPKERVPCEQAHPSTQQGAWELAPRRIDVGRVPCLRRSPLAGRCLPYRRAALPSVSVHQPAAALNTSSTSGLASIPSSCRIGPSVRPNDSIDSVES